MFLLQAALPPEFIKAVDQIDYTSPVTKINGTSILFFTYQQQEHLQSVIPEVPLIKLLNAMIMISEAAALY